MMGLVFPQTCSKNLKNDIIMKVKTYNDVEKHRSAKDGQCPVRVDGCLTR